MVFFEYVITDELGIHSRPAGELIREVKNHQSRVVFSHGEKKADGDKLFAIMKLGIKHGNTLGVTVEGSDENETAAALEQLLRARL
jgi:phosphocarrier protein